jgi:hypothetical protein
LESGDKDGSASNSIGVGDGRGDLISAQLIERSGEGTGDVIAVNKGDKFDWNERDGGEFD